MQPNSAFRLVSFALKFALLSSSAALAQGGGVVRFELETKKTYRQPNRSEVGFRDGYFRMQLRDGDYTVSPCAPSPVDFAWFPPTDIPPCPLGATGFVTAGPLSDYWGSLLQGEYWSLASVVPAVAIEPYALDRCKLLAAPLSTLPRPQTLFEDACYSIFYDIGVTSTDAREYRITNYAFDLFYRELDDFGDVVPSAYQEQLMDAQIVPGNYQYAFPRLDSETQEVGLWSRYYNIPEGYKTKPTKRGVLFTYPSQFDPQGFALLNVKDLKNPVKWQGITSSNAYAAVDKLYFSIKELREPDNPNSESLETAVFPPYQSPTTPTRILLKSPFVSSYQVPPTLYAGSKGVIELELVRSATSQGVIYDVSSRRYQMPVFIGDHYYSYVLKTFGTKITTNIGLDDDYDGDGFNNVAEWILGSNAKSAGSTPKAPKPAYVSRGGTVGSFYGFRIAKNTAAVPTVEYTLTRSTDGGLTYEEMFEDANWKVINNGSNDPNDPYFDPAFDARYPANTIGIESKIIVGGKPVLPPGTATHLYRIGVKPA